MNSWFDRKTTIRISGLIFLFFAVSTTFSEETEKKPEYTPHELGKSYVDLAGEQFEKKEYGAAIKYLGKWLKADPGDSQSWYNLACAYALTGKPEKALTAFEKSVDAGWDDTHHASQDPDLESIRKEQRYTEALKRCEENQKQDTGPENAVRHFVKMESYWTYLAALPPDYESSDKEYPICVILHGRGSTETGHGRLADSFGREGVFYICPRAPYPCLPVVKFMKQEGYTAWPMENIQEEMHQAGDLVRQYADWIFLCVEDAKKRYRVRDSGIFIFGHSQGGAYANVCAMLYPEKVASYFSYAGYFMESFKDIAYFNMLKKEGIKPYLAHSLDDPVVSIDESVAMSEYMEKAGIEFVFEKFKGNHGVNDEVIGFTRKWIQTEIIPDSPSPEQ